MDLRKLIREIIESVYMDEEISAYHGSPHEFDKFSMEKMGTGEGVQAFGWGLYFTDLEGVAKNYANMGESPHLKFDDNTPDSIVKIGNEMFEAFEYSKEEILNYMERNKEEFEYYEELKKAIEKAKVVLNKNLYKVTLHKGKSPDQYTWLEWDKPIPKNQLKKIYDQFRKEEYNGRVKIQGDKIYKDWGGIEEIKKGKDFYSSLAGDKNFTPKEASLFLLRAGIDGIKYPAESISRGTTSETASGFNYVVFDENAVEIEKIDKF